MDFEKYQKLCLGWKEHAIYLVSKVNRNSLVPFALWSNKFNKIVRL